MYWQKSNTLQGESPGKNIRFKENLIFWIFLSVTFGIFASIYLSVLSAAIIGIGGCLAALLLRNKKIAVVLLFFAISVIRAGGYVPTTVNLEDAKALGFNIEVSQTATYEFMFADQVEAIRLIPQKVLGDRGALVAAVVFGDKTGLERNTKTAFRIAGISHILAVSGLHVGIIVSIINYALKKAKKHIRLIAICAIVLVLVIVSGCSPSVLRASLMIGVYLLSEVLGRRYDLLRSLFFSGTVILLLLPYNIFNVGFLLSFSSVLGIGLFYKDIFARLKVLGNEIGCAISMYIACQITTLPVIIYVFKEVSILGVLGNIFAVPIVSFALGCGIVGIVLYPIGLAYYPLSFSAAFMEMIEYIAKVIEDVPFALVATGTVSVLLLGAYYVILSVPCVSAMDKKEPHYWTIGLVLCTILTISMIYV